MSRLSPRVVALVLELPSAMVVPVVIPVVTVLELPDAVVPVITPVVPVLLPGLGVSDAPVVAPVLEILGEMVLSGVNPIVPV